MASQAFPVMASTRHARSWISTRWPELLALIVGIESALAALLSTGYHYNGHIPWTDYYLIWLIPAGVVFFGIFLTWLWKLYRQGEDHPIAASIEKLCSIPGRAYVELFVPIFVMAPFLASYTTFKVVLVNIGAHGLDPTLARIDNMFGFEPWQVSHAILGPLGTMVLDRLYYCWFVVNQLMLIGVLFVPILVRQRAQVLLTFVFVWIVLGSLLAALFPSVGPCYYGNVYNPDLYAGLMAQLHTINQTYPLTALGVQDLLWFDHTHDVMNLGSGVSAMPSMHVAVATITALLLRRIGLSILGAFWLGAIWLGSFHLGWHYAIDGLVSVLGTVAIWKVVAMMLAGGTSPLHGGNPAQVTAAQG